MHQLFLLCELVALLFGLEATALKRDLKVVNAQIAPDGFSRS